MMNIRSAVALLSLSLVVSAKAATVTVLPGDPTWANPPGENGGGGSSSITTTAPRSGNGSIEMFGDRTRYVGLGNFYDSNSNLGLLSSLASLTFDWSVATDSGSNLGPNYTPALRVHIWDGNQRSELIWEGAYNGVTVTAGTWATSGAADNFWRYQTGIGDSLIYNNSIADWQSSGLYSANAYISGFSVGVGSSVGSHYHAFADNITITTARGLSTTYNFETSASSSVPEAGSTLALVGLALAGIAGLRRKLIA